ncbi:MAG: thioredoxin domain-containing protein [Deltaproteobacteria bacterium]|nr:thioredoxin domain-containing protein [Kofleriaceae bacterium]
MQIRLFVLPVAALAIGLLTGASCKKDSTAKTDPKDVIAAADNAKAGPVDKTPLPGVDVSGLPAAKQETFYRLVGSLPSPCGKAHSLRTSVTSDQSCKRAPFAARLVAELLVDEQSNDVVQDLYAERYTKNTAVQTIDVGAAPMAGEASAPVTLVEFFDYGCPACMQLKPALDMVLKENRSKLKIYYKMYPLVKAHPDSLGAAKAALAAHAQGKFHAMHDLIFDRFGAHKESDLRGYAQQLGLDMARYETDFAAAEARVKADMEDGTAVGVDGTPTLFLNGRKYPGPSDPKYFAAAIEEELAVRR